MVVDRLENLLHYAPLHPDLAPIVDWIRDGRLEGLAPGDHPGPADIKRVIMEVHPTGKAANEARLEAHDRHIDLQICLLGRETFGWAPRASLKRPQAAFDEKRDLGFWLDDASFHFTLSQGDFALFWPGDAHAPGIGTERFHKIVFKIPVR